MKTIVPLTYMGRCENPACQDPYHFVPVHAVIDPKELPERCHCGAAIKWEKGVHRHNVQSIKKKGRRLNPVILVIAAILAIAGGVAAYCTGKIYKTHSSEEMTTALRQVKAISCAGILNTMADAGFSEKRLSRLLDSYPSVIHRIRTGKTQASPQFESVLKEVYADYLLTGSWSVVCVKYHLIARPDPFLVGTHPFQEMAIE